MAARVLPVALVGFAHMQVAEGINHGYVSSEEFIPRVNIEGAVSAETLVSEESLPQNFDWRDVGGRTYVTSDWNQHIPEYCGACWMHGTVSALNDRIKIMRGAAFPDIRLGRQSMINCVPPADGKGPPPGCDGGDFGLVHRYMHTNKVPDESCLPYQARNMGCTPFNVCRNCAPGDKGCWPVKNWIGYGVSSHGVVSGEKAMMKEIYARGPIPCSFATDDAFMYGYSANALQNEGVYVNNTHYNKSQIDHVMEVAGWGETKSGLKYWVIRNSWGTYWGEGGWLKLKRGENQLLSESDCGWAVPSFEALDGTLSGRVWGDYMKGTQPLSAYESGNFDEVLAETPSKVKEVVVPLGASLSGQGVHSVIDTDSSLVVAVFAAFAVGALVPLAAIAIGRRTSVREQPPLLG